MCTLNGQEMEERALLAEERSNEEISTKVIENTYNTRINIPGAHQQLEFGIQQEHMYHAPNE